MKIDSKTSSEMNKDIAQSNNSKTNPNFGAETEEALLGVYEGNKI